MSDFDRELDARGMACPMPIYKSKQVLEEMESGQVLRVVATDSASAKDFPLFCTQTDNELVSATDTDGEYTYIIRKR